MSEELKIKISADVSELKKEMEKGKKAVEDFTKESEKQTKSLRETISDQTKSLAQLKEKYADVVAAEGKNSKSAKDLAKQIKSTSKELKTNKSAMDDANAAADKLDKTLKDSKKAFSDFADGFSKVGDACKKGLAIAGGAIVGAGTAILALGESTSEYRNEQAKLVSAFEAAGQSADEAKQTYNDLYRVLGDSGQATEAANHLAKLCNTQEELSQWTKICQGVYATFGDSLPIEGLTEAANETAKTGELTGVLTDALNWASASTEDFANSLFTNEDAIKAYNKAIADGENREDAFKAALEACNSEAEREQLIRETLNGIYSEAADIYEGNNAAILAQNEANQKMTDSLAKIGEAVQPINTALTELGAEILAQLAPYVTEFAEKYLPQIQEALSGVGEKIGEVITWIADNWDLVCTIAGTIAAIAAAISVLSTVIGIVNGVIAITNVVTAPVLGTIALVVAAIAAVIAIIVVCIKYWDEICETVSKVCEEIGEWVSNVCSAIGEFFTNLWTKITEIWDGICESISNIIDKIKTAISDKFNAAKEKVVSIFTNVKTSVLDIFNNIKTGISDKINSIKNTFSTGFNAAKNTVVGIFNGIKDSITEKITAAKDKVKSVIDAIKGFFNFKFSWPNIPMPHFGISPSGWKIGDLLKGSIPKLNINWYATGGVFDEPTLFGSGSGLTGIGEDGAEAVVPLEKNTQWLDRIAEMLVEKQGGNRPIVLQVDGKTFAQISVDSINQLTRQRGAIPLNLY